MNETPIFKCSIESRQLADWLSTKARQGNHGEIITYHQLSNIAGCNVLEKRNVLQTARNIVLRENNAWFVVVRGEGIKLADARETSGEGEISRTRITGIARRGMRRMAATQYEKLSQEERVMHNMNASILGAVRILNGKASRTRLAGAVAQAEDKISFRDTLKLFHVQNGNTSQS